MSRWTRWRDTFRRRDRVLDDIDEELQSHIDEAVASGREVEEARRALGSRATLRDQSQDTRIAAWFDALRSDAWFSWRQWRKRPVTSTAALLSLALAIGACLSAFRVTDALLWRPLPIVHPEQLYALSRGAVAPDGFYRSNDVWSYPSLVSMQSAVGSEARLLAVSPAAPVDVTIESGGEPDRVSVQYVAGDLFGAFGVTAAAGRVLLPSDDVATAEAVGVLGYNFWQRRFGRAPEVIGRRVVIGGASVEIVGVAAQPFVGVETGVSVDLYLPAARHSGVTRDDWTWTRAMAIVQPGVNPDRLGSELDAAWHAEERERASHFVNVPPAAVAGLLTPVVRIDPAPSGASSVRTNYARPLGVIAALVALVLLIACVNLALLLSAQSAARGREMSLRASIGAGRSRLAQLAIVECAMLGAAAAGLGSLFSTWAAPFVVARAAAPDSTIALAMPFDARVSALALALAAVATVVVGAWPAWRAWRTRPMDPGGSGTGRETGRSMTSGLVIAQVAFGTFVLLVAGLAVGTFQQLVSRPLGFVQDHVTILDVTAARALPITRWNELGDAIRALPGTADVSFAGWPMLAGKSWNGFVSVDGAPATSVLADFLNVSPSFFDALSMPLVAGRTFLPSETQPGAAVVNETFARMFLADRPALGRRIAKGDDAYTVVGIVRDAVYRDVHQPQLPVAFVPFRQVDTAVKPQTVRSAAVLVRGDGAPAADAIRRIVRGTDADFRLLSIRSAQSLEDAQLVRERLLAMLAAFFGIASAVLVGLGLYGTLHYRVVRRRREIAIRRAIGAGGSSVVWLLAHGLVVALTVGTALGIASGYVATGAAESLFYGVRRTDIAMLALPALAMAGIGVVASLIPLRRALRVNPVSILRGD